MAQHPLFRKRGMDAVNQELLQETDYPAADKDYNNPWGSKGTEYDPTKTGAANDSDPSHRAMEFRKLLAQMIRTLERASGFSPDNAARQMIWNMLDQASRYQTGHTAAVGGKATVDYLKLAEAIAASLDLLSRVAPKGGHIQAFAQDSAGDLRDWIAQDRSHSHTTASLRRGYKRAANPAQSKYEDPRFLNITINRLRAMQGEIHKHPDLAGEFDCDWDTIKDAIAYLQRMKGSPSQEKAPEVEAKPDGWSYDTPFTPEDKAYLEKMKIKGRLRERLARKRAEIQQHADPKFLPPRNDMRSHLDEDVKKEIEAEKEA